MAKMRLPEVTDRRAASFSAGDEPLFASTRASAQRMDPPGKGTAIPRVIACGPFATAAIETKRAPVGAGSGLVWLEVRLPQKLCCARGLSATSLRDDGSNKRPSFIRYGAGRPGQWNSGFNFHKESMG